MHRAEVWSAESREKQHAPLLLALAIAAAAAAVAATVVAIAPTAMGRTGRTVNRVDRPPRPERHFLACILVRGIVVLCAPVVAVALLVVLLLFLLRTPDDGTRHVVTQPREGIPREQNASGVVCPKKRAPCPSFPSSPFFSSCSAFIVLAGPTTVLTQAVATARNIARRSHEVPRPAGLASVLPKTSDGARLLPLPARSASRATEALCPVSVKLCAEFPWARSVRSATGGPEYWRIDGAQREERCGGCVTGCARVWTSAAAAASRSAFSLAFCFALKSSQLSRFVSCAGRGMRFHFSKKERAVRRSTKERETD